MRNKRLNIEYFPSECIIHRGRPNKNGYGYVYVSNKKQDRAHRVVYRLFVGYIHRSKMVCHSCDVRNCINPKHLFLGTAKDNSRDMSKKGRSGNPGSKLSNENVLKIRRLYSSGCQSTEIGKKFGVSRSTVWNIGTKTTWRHL